MTLAPAHKSAAAKKVPNHKRKEKWTAISRGRFLPFLWRQGMTTPFYICAVARLRERPNLFEWPGPSLEVRKIILQLRSSLSPRFLMGRSWHFRCRFLALLTALEKRDHMFGGPGHHLQIPLGLAPKVPQGIDKLPPFATLEKFNARRGRFVVSRRSS